MARKAAKASAELEAGEAAAAAAAGRCALLVKGRCSLLLSRRTVSVVSSNWLMRMASFSDRSSAEAVSMRVTSPTSHPPC